MQKVLLRTPTLIHISVKHQNDASPLSQCALLLTKSVRSKPLSSPRQYYILYNAFDRKRKMHRKSAEQKIYRSTKFDEMWRYNMHCVENGERYMGWIRWLNFCTQCRSITYYMATSGICERDIFERFYFLVAKYFKFGADLGKYILELGIPYIYF